MFLNPVGNHDLIAIVSGLTQEEAKQHCLLMNLQGRQKDGDNFVRTLLKTFIPLFLLSFSHLVAISFASASVVEQERSSALSATAATAIEWVVLHCSWKRVKMAISRFLNGLSSVFQRIPCTRTAAQWYVMRRRPKMARMLGWEHAFPESTVALHVYQ